MSEARGRDAEARVGSTPGSRPSDPPDVHLREVADDDTESFYAFQADEDAARMAGMSRRDEAAFRRNWEVRVLGDDTVVKRTVLENGRVVGHVVCFGPPERRVVGYWIGREFWGRGLATAALRALLELVETRPLHAHVAKHNAGSIRVLEKCGFRLSGEGTIPRDDLEEGIPEYLYTLDEE